MKALTEMTKLTCFQRARVRATMGDITPAESHNNRCTKCNRFVQQLWITRGYEDEGICGSCLLDLAKYYE
jgi:hypothetical protein